MQISDGAESRRVVSGAEVKDHVDVDGDGEG